MKKIILFVCLIAALTIPFSVLAQSPTAATQPDTINSVLNQAAGSNGAGYDTSVDETGLSRVVGTIVKTVISLIGIIFVSFTVYGGFLYLTSAGNEEKIEKAKSIIKNGIIGIIIIICAAAIYTFVANMLISGTSSVPYSS